MSQGFFSTASALLPGLDLDQLVVLLRRRLRALAARPAEVLLRLLGGLRLCRCLGAVGLDHHQSGAFEILLRIDARRLHAGGRGRCRLGFHRHGFFLLNGLLCLSGSRYRRILVAALAVPVPAMPAPAAALLVGFALGRALLLWLLGLWRSRRTLLLRPAIAARRLPIAALLEPARLRARLGHRRRLVRRDALDDRDLALALRLGFLARGFGLLGPLDQLVARRHVLHFVELFVPQPLHLVVRRLEVRVRHQHDVDLEPRLELLDLGALLVEQERGHVHRHLRVHRAGVLLHRLFLQDPQHVQRGRLGAADEAGAAAARAADVRGFFQRGLQPLARQLHQAEARDLADLHAGAVELQRVAQAVLDVALVALRFHVDEIDHDQAAEVAQPELAGDFVGRLQVRAQRGLLDVAAARGAGRVDVDGNQRLGVVDDDRAAGGQGDLARIGVLDLVLDLEAREQRHVVAVELDLADVARHHGLHEGAGLLVDFLGIDQDLADIGLEVVADRPDDEARLEVDEERLLRLVGRGAFDRAPQLHQVVQVPVQLLRRAADRRSAGDDAHAVGQLQLVERVAKLVAVFALDAPRDAAAARIVRHQDQVASRQADEGGQRGALAAALVLLDLDDQLLAFAQRILDAGAADVDVRLEIAAGDFLEREEPVPLLAVVDEGGFEAGLDAGDDAFVDVALALLP